MYSELKYNFKHSILIFLMCFAWQIIFFMLSLSAQVPESIGDFGLYYSAYTTWCYIIKTSQCKHNDYYTEENIPQNSYPKVQSFSLLVTVSVLYSSSLLTLDHQSPKIHAVSLRMLRVCWCLHAIVGHREVGQSFPAFCRPFRVSWHSPYTRAHLPCS